MTGGPEPLAGARVALVLLSAIGDVVHAFPLASSLRAAAPGGSLEWFVQPVPASLVRSHPAVDRVWLFERRRGWRGWRDIRRAVRGERFDLVIDLQVYAKASLLTLLLDSPRKLGFDRPRARELNWLVTNERIPARANDHVREQYLEFADHLRVPRRYEWPLPLSAAERAERDAFLDAVGRPVASVVTTSSDVRKDWPPERWARVAEGLYEMGYAVCLAGGVGRRESERAAEVVRLAGCPVRDERRLDLRHLLGFLDGSAIVVSPDTGPYHMAVALDVPTVGLYAATDPARHGPGHRYLDLLIDAYHDPGEGWRPVRPARRPGRMARISPADVLDAVARARARYPRAVQGPARGTGSSPA